MNSDIQTQVCIVGGGPAGLMAGLLFARAGVETVVLEKHGDFLRDFRGDTIHPSTLELFDQLGLLEELLALPHSKAEQIGARVAGKFVRVADFRSLKTPAPFIAMMPQWDLLDFIAKEALRYPTFRLMMQAEATGIVSDENDRIAGTTLADGRTVSAKLVIAADGRRSVLRESAALPLEELGAPMDVFWFRVPKDGPEESFGVFERGHIVILIDRGDYWQCAFVFAKGDGERMKRRPIEEFRRELAEAVPALRYGIDSVRSWDDIKLLSVALDRLICWHRPGLLAIGDAAHAMTPLGGVGINLAVQDAVAAANILAGPMAAGADPDPLLGAIQKRRWKPTIRIQRLQRIAQNNVIAPLISGRSTFEKPPLPVRLLNRIPFLRRIPAHIIGLGFSRERIESPDAFGSG